MFRAIRFYLLVSLNLSLWLALTALVDGVPVKAQITEANPNDTGTNINIVPGQNFTNINGGRESGANLFHSFERFNVNNGETVNFTLPNTNIENVINRVGGGEASVINGAFSTSISGEEFSSPNPNFFLMNPAGIIFGSSANLDVFSSFTATTANGIGFGSDWFNASGTNNYEALTGNPTAFGFTMSQPGGIDIRGNLSVSGGNLNLIGGTVVSTGEISGEQVNITTVPGNSLVTLTEPGSPLSLQIQPISASSTQPNNWNLPILSLPQLLTAGNGGNADRFTDNGDGTIQLSGSGITVANGDVVLENVTESDGDVSVVSAVNTNISANRNLTVEGNINETPSGENSVNLSAQGDITTKDINLSSYGGPVELFAEGNIITGDISTFLGSAEDSNGKVNIEAGKDITVGNIDTSVFGGGDSVILDAGGNITTGFIRAGNSNSKNGDVSIISREGSINIEGSASNNNSIFANSIEINTSGNLDIASGLNARNDREQPAGNVTIGNQLIPTSITVGDITTRNLGSGDGGKIDIRTSGSFNARAAFSEDTGDSVNPINSDNVVSIGSEADRNGGEINIIADGGITTAAGIASNSASSGDGGKITLTSNTGVIKIGGSINSFGFGESGNTGAIAITHDGGANNLPFTVGEVSENGTAGVINNGTPQEFPVLSNGGDAINTPNRITITSINSPPTLTANQQIELSATEPTQLTLEDLNPVVNDANGDNTSIRIDEVTSGTLKINGEEVTSGTIQPGDNLEYIPPANTVGDISAFVISVSDGVSSSTAQIGGRIDLPVQSDIVPASNDTNTQVPENLALDEDERIINITGGETSGNNLFHSFSRFNVIKGETANFLPDDNPNINNVINRVIGGNESIIDGDIRVGGDSVNFYLMNPAGIIFGDGSTLNVPGTFTATTANGIGFGSNWFNASGSNNYNLLNSNSTSFGFTMSQPGGIDIRGDLNVTGGNLNLIGGTVISTGEITGNQVNITTVPGNTLVNLTEPGNPLSLAIQPISASSTQPNNWSLPILSLPELLTAGNGGNANRFIDNGDGTIQFSGSGITVENGDVALENIITGDFEDNGDVNLNAQGNITTGNINVRSSDAPGDVSLNAGEDVAFNSINAGVGNVNITAGGIIQGTGTIPNLSDEFEEVNIPANTTILTGGGSIQITHNGGADNVPFKIGDASENGTLGAIDSGINARIAPGNDGTPVEFPVLPNGGDATNTPNGITISSVNSPPNLTANQQISLSKTQSTQLTFEELNALVDDADGDNTSIQIDEVTSGTLRINGVEVTSSATINPGDNLEYTPPANTIGDINGFVISAGDGVSSSTPQTVGGTIENTPPTLESNPEILTTENQPSEFTFEDLKAIVNDADGDEAFVEVDQVTTGTLTRNGEVVTPGTRLSAGDILEYTPPENTNGNIPAFTIRANDGFESSTPQQIGVTAVPQEDNPQKPPQVEPPFQPPKFPTNPLPPINIDPVVLNIDDKFATAYESYFNFSKRERVSLVKAREILLKIEKAAGVKPAIIYVSFTPIKLDASSQNKQIIEFNQLDVVLVTANGEPIRKTIHTTNQEEVYSVANQFYDQVLEPNNNKYLAPAQKLYQWIIAPLEEELKAQGINNLLFITSEHLRSIPLAALHDGKQFLVEKYSVGFTPSLSLTNTEYKDIRKSQVLAMGASEFENANPLPGVAQEVSIIAEDIWQGRYLLNKDFTLENLKSLKNQFGIIHLATHGQFNGGPPEDSFVLLWNNKLNLNEFGDLKFNDPTVELLVLSACETAMGDEQAELGFGGLAVRTGAKTALAGLWQVDDSATLGLMAEFYQQLRKAPIKSEALRQAQIAMLKGKIRVENGQLRTSTRGVPLPPEVVQSLSERKINTLTHPYYWAAFTMIGNPW